MNISNILKLIFSPDSFADAEVKDAEKKITEEGAVYGDLDEWRSETLVRVAKKRRGMLISFIVVLVTVLLGYFTAILFNHYFPLDVLIIRLVRVGATILITWSVLSRLGYEVTTMDGTTLLERTNLETFKFFYIIAIFIATVSLFLEPMAFNNQIQPTVESGG